MDLSEAPVEILESIFKHMKPDTLPQCRLVCRKWNEEIVSHGELIVIIDQETLGNIEFFKKINFPFMIKIKSINKFGYHLIRTHAISNTVMLQLGGLGNPISPNNILNLKYFSDYCENLTVLEIYNPVLASHNFESELKGGNIKKNSLFNNLKILKLNHYEHYDQQCDGVRVLKTSMNIQFLLERIGTKKLQVFGIHLNTLFIDINCCYARYSYRFEDSVLPEFLARQSNLIDLSLDIPQPMPNTDWSFDRLISTLPTKMKKLDLVARICKTGNEVYNIATRHQDATTLRFPELLTWDENFYRESINPAHSTFWKTFVLNQTELKSLRFTNNGGFGGPEFLMHIVENNFATLTRIYFVVEMVGLIDAVCFKNTAIRDIIIYNESPLDILHNLVHGQTCWLGNTIYLPKSVRVIVLKNVFLLPENLRPITKLELIKFSMLYDPWVEASLQKIPFDIVKEIFRMRQLDKFTIVGQVDFFDAGGDIFQYDDLENPNDFLSLLDEYWVENGTEADYSPEVEFEDDDN